jgi:hypothetical protein
VHIYRLISHHTIEENILRKSNQKRHLDHLAIQSGGYSGGTGPTTAGDTKGDTSTGTGMGAADIREMLGTDLIQLPGDEDDQKPKQDKENAENADDSMKATSPVVLSEEEVKKAMASAEDDEDKLAAAAAERELAEENRADFEEGGDGCEGADGHAVLKATATDAHSMLKQIEKYAVRVWFRIINLFSACGYLHCWKRATFIVALVAWTGIKCMYF